MTLYAKITRAMTDTGEREHMPEAPPGPDDLAAAKPYWVPVVEETDDTSTGPDKITSAWVDTVEATRLLRTRTIRDRTAQEIDDAKTQAALARIANVSGKLDKLEIAGLFWCVNEIRTLKGQAVITVDQFLTALDGFADQMPDAKFRDKIKEML